MSKLQLIARSKLIIAYLMISWISTPSMAEDFAVELISKLSEQIKVEPPFTAEVISIDASVSSDKRVLIYHTHTYEAYEQSEATTYQQTEKWRTTDSSYNMIAVGKALAANLRALGINVVHDTTAFEPPSLESAYERSLAMLKQRIAAGEHYDLYLDLHRDALAASSSIKRTVNIGGEEVARFMVLVGQGMTGGYVEKPNWEANLQLAQTLTDALNGYCPQLARDVKIKTGRFNQHISEGCLLIECGLNYNTLTEVLASIPYLADAIVQTLNK